MTTTPLAAPLIIAALTIGRPSDTAVDAVIDTITRFGSEFTINDCNSIMTSALRLGDTAISTRIADALNHAQGIND